MKHLLTYKLFEKKDNKVILEFPDTRQSDYNSCGVAATQSVAIYYGIDKPEDYYSGNDKKTYQSAKDIMNFFEKNDFKVEEKHNMKIDDLKKLIDKKIPIIVAIQAWSDNNVDYSKDFKDGHWVVVIGYDDNNLYFNDPSIADNIGIMSQTDFKKRWHDKEGKKEFINYGIVVYGEPKFKLDKYQKIN
jgi:ABC-type bacteriocin/lantibiotic exporter with double-glycine peptidase domain